MCSLSQQIIESPARPKPKTLLSGEMERHHSSDDSDSQTLGLLCEETRDDVVEDGGSSSNSTSSSRHSASSTFPVIPFSKTFAVAESYRKKSPLQMTSTNATSQFHDNTPQQPQHQQKQQQQQQQQHPLRRRARSSEGITMRKLQSEGHHYSSSFDQHEQEIRMLEASLKSPQHFFSPLGGNSAKITSRQIRQRKNNLKRKKSLTPASEPSSAKNTVISHQRKTGKHGQRDKSSYVIPIEHPFKVAWDILTVVLSIVHGYLTHVAIRDRQFGFSPFSAFCNVWFLLDILLNFVTERKTSTGEVLSDHRSIVARYLTSWFAVDALSLFPWECLYMKPLVELQNRRGILKKSFFRSKAVVRVTRHLRGRHFRWFGTVAKHTKQHGIGGQRLFRLLIKYIPKYCMFLRNMKAIVAIRIIRYIHWGRRFFHNMQAQNEIVTTGSPKSTYSDASTKSVTTREAEDDSLHDLGGDDDDDLRNVSVEVVYDDWNWKMHFGNDSYYNDDDDDDDGVPL